MAISGCILGWIWLIVRLTCLGEAGDINVWLCQSSRGSLRIKLCPSGPRGVGYIEPLGVCRRAPDPLMDLCFLAACKHEARCLRGLKRWLACVERDVIVPFIHSATSCCMNADFSSWRHIGHFFVDCFCVPDCLFGSQQSHFEATLAWRGKSPPPPRKYEAHVSKSKSQGKQSCKRQGEPFKQANFNMARERVYKVCGTYIFFYPDNTLIEICHRHVSKTLGNCLKLEKINLGEYFLTDVSQSPPPPPDPTPPGR